MRDRRQTNAKRSEYGAATVLALIALLLLALAGTASGGVQPLRDGAFARVVATDGLVAEGGFREAAGSGSMGHAPAMIEAGSVKTATLQVDGASLHRASDDVSSETPNTADEGTGAKSSDEHKDEEGEDAPAQNAEEPGEPSSGDQSATGVKQDEQDAVQSDQSEQNGQENQPSQPNQSGKNDQPAQTQANDKADSDGNAAQQKPDDSAAQDDKTILEKTLTCVNGTSYKITLSYDAKANIPSNAQLRLVELNRSLTKKEKEDEANKDRPLDSERFVSKSALSKRGEVLDRALKLTDNDYRHFTKYMDVMLVADGKTVVPDAPVELTIETRAVSQDKAGTLEVALKTEVDKPTKKDPYAYELLGGKNETDEKESTSRLTFTTQKLGEFALVGVAYSMGSWNLDGMKINVMGPRDLKSANMPGISVDTGDEGLQLRQAFEFKVKPAPKYGTTLWISAKPVADAQAEAKEGSLCGYSVLKGQLDERIFDYAGTKKPVEFSSDDEGVALVWDTGYRHQSFDIKKVSLDGMLPEGVSATATSVRKDYRDHASISRKLTRAAKAMGATLKTVAAYDISMSADGAAYQPSEDRPVTVSISSKFINEDGLYQVWHVRDNGSVELVEDATLAGDTVSFEATDLNVFMVVETTLEDALEAVPEDDRHNPKVAIEAGEYDPEKGTINYTVTLEAEGDLYFDGMDHPVTLEDLTSNAESNLVLDTMSAQYTYAHKEGFEPQDEAPASKVNGKEVSDGTEDFGSFPITVANMYDGDRLTLSYTAIVVGADYDSAQGTISVENTATITSANNTHDDEADNTATARTRQSLAYEPLQKERTDLEGSWATWQLEVNPKGFSLNGGEPLTLKDNFNPNPNSETQSIDYASITVTDGVSYDYRGSTGTFVIPDACHATITYRTRIKAQPGEVVDYGNVATLLNSSSETIAEASVSERETIYPSASDVASTSGVYMVKLYVYGDGSMQTGIPGAQFILLDANARPMTFKTGDHAGEGVIFTTDEDGYADIRLDGTDGGVSIQKNTAYYLEMIKAPEGYKRDSTLYSFMITDDPSYNSGGFWTYYNGDTMKVRLYPEGPSLNVSLRLSGNYSLRQDQQDEIVAILQKKTGEDAWEEVERHPYTEFSYGSMVFETGSSEHPFELGATYRIVQENEYPWDLDSSVIFNTTYYLIVGSADSVSSGSPIEFTINEDGLNSSYNVVINDEYEEPELKLTKMDKLTGETLSGAVFTVRKAKDDTVVKTYTTDESGVVAITGGPDFESETLYYVVETEAPTGYLMPLSPEKTYFYFCNDPFLEPTILVDLPEDETAVNLSETYDALTIDNQKRELTIPVMKTWQGNVWPQNVDSVTIGLYKSVDGGTPEKVLGQNDEPLTVVLRSTAPYNNKAFMNLPARDEENKPITYSIAEEKVTSTDGRDILEDYVQEYGISDAGVYIVRNKLATTLTVNKEWYDLATDQKVTSAEELAKQPAVFFNVYRSTQKISDEVRADGITNEEMANFARGLTKVRSRVSFSGADGWTKSITDLDKYADSGLPYYYYVYEVAPSFGNELYEVGEEQGTVLIKNKTVPETVAVTVRKAALVNDPRPESAQTEFSFTLALKKGSYDIRRYEVSDGLLTGWDGKATFTLTPENQIVLNLPVGVVATVTEAVNPEYVETAASTDIADLDDKDGVFKFEVDRYADGATVTYTNTLRVICKVVDKNNEQHPFESLKSALAHVRAKPDLYDEPVFVQVLEDYVMPATDVFDVQPGESIVLTTASTTDGQFPFRTDRTQQTDTAIITRGAAGGSMLTNEGTLLLGKIILDGTGTEVTANGGLVNNTGTLNITNGATLRNSSTSGMGGAIYSTGVINMPGGNISGNSARQGSAIYLASGTLNMTGGRIENNVSATDGAVAVYDTRVRINLSGDPVVFGNENANGEWANIYLGADSDNVISIVEPGLDASDGLIGVRAIETHREIGEQFASAQYGMTNNLNRFVNDLYEYRGKLKDGTSTNVVWDGLSLTINKVVESRGANANDRFTVTLKSTSIRKSTYAIGGTVDYDVTPATTSKPGTIVFRNVKDSDAITVNPLPVGRYTIEEAASNYSPVYAGQDLDNNNAIAFDGETFTLNGDSVVTLTNTRRLAPVTLTKRLDDRLKGADETAEFPFTISLNDADGTPFAEFELVAGVATDENGVATTSMLPAKSAPAEKDFEVPVGATMSIEETDDPNYTIAASGRTSDGAGITDEDTENANVFAFEATDDGADVTFSNVRKMAEIQLRKVLFNKVSATESFDFVVTLSNGDGQAVKGFLLYEDEEHPENNIRTDDDGKATITFEFTRDEEPLTKGKTLTIPEGTRLRVEETEVRKLVAGTSRAIYDTTVSVNEGTAATGRTATIASVSDDDHSIIFSNTRKMRTIVVKNTVSGYSGNVVPFTYTATVTDGGDDDYDINGFTDGVMTFELTSGQTETLTVPYGATLTVTEGFVVGYDTNVKRGSASAVTALSDTFVVNGNMSSSSPLAFTNSQLIGLRIVNNTSSDFEDITVTVEKNKIYRVNSDETGQELIGSGNTATFSVAAGKTAILEIQHDTKVTSEQLYTVQGVTPTTGYCYTINNEPSFHEYADPAILRVYSVGNYEVKGKLRYSVSDSIVTFTEQPLVTFDANGGVWTTEMDGYHDKDGSRTAYQKAVTTGETVAAPTPDPVYPTAEQVAFLGWTADEAFAKAAHTASDDVSDKLYDFDTPVEVPITLYAIWARDPNAARVVTVKNGLNTTLTVNVELTNSNGTPAASWTLYEDAEHPENNITTDSEGNATFTLSANDVRNLKVPENAKLVISADAGIAHSTDFSDADSVTESFTIESVDRDGIVSFIGGICKITDADGNLLYDGSGKPAVYTTLTAAFTAYTGTLYADSQQQARGTAAVVKLLVDEYFIEETTPIAFPNATLKLTTAGKTDADFPYVGVRDRSTIYRTATGASASCFSLSVSGTITLADIVLDGGSEQSVRIASAVNGGLISKSAGTLTVSSGTTMRNCEFAAYTDTTNSRGGAIYMTGGTLNVNAGLFSNLHAYQGGALCVTGGTLNVTGTSGSTRFENCYAERQDGGAIYYKVSKNLVIDGGEGRNNPGIIFSECAATYTNEKSDTGDGGAIYANPGYNYTVTVKGCEFTECSAKTANEKSTSGFGGGGISAYQVKTLSVSHCSFNACDTLCGGGAVVAYVNYTTADANDAVNFNDCTFDQCNSKSQGGALAIYQDGTKQKSSATKLSVINSTFTGCSSGTNNGSGGAIQCYLPCMVFTGSSFTDCWAGKEGGAVNNYFGDSYTEVWAKSKAVITDCHFIRCRAEDRYDTTALQHYGGGINSKAKVVEVADSTFEDCVSTLREGGALHIGGQGGGSEATITGSTFKNCTAKNGGGAILSSHETLEIDSCNFYGCSSSASNGGAVYHYRNSRGDSTQKNTTITDSKFSVDLDDSGDNVDDTEKIGCYAAQNGGAIWTRATTSVALENLTIEYCRAGNQGGGIYLNSTTNGVEISGGTITNCQAVNGSAAYVGNTATFSDDLDVTGNIVSEIASGAIHTVASGQLYFKDNVKVEDNKCSSDDTYDHDVLMQINNVTIINTSGDDDTPDSGLGEEANIGVYVPDQYFNNRGIEGKAFGTYGNSEYLDAFFNDRDDRLFGYSLDESEDDKKIYWGYFVCKITDADGNTLKRPNSNGKKDAVYQKLSTAFGEFSSVTGGTPVYVKMLVEEYNIKQTAAISNFPAADVTLTTAAKSDGQHPYRGTEGTVCTISRTNSNNRLFDLNTSGAIFQLQGITLDGRKDKTAVNGDYGLIKAKSGQLIINGDTTLQYGHAGDVAEDRSGAAVFATTDATVTINGEWDDKKEEATVKFINCEVTNNDQTGSSNNNAGAIYAGSLTITKNSAEADRYGTAFIGCNSRRGGAIYVNGSTMDIDGAMFQDCYSASQGGAIYHDNANATSTTISNSAFTSCYADQDPTATYARYSNGGALVSRAKTLTVDGCTFTSCYALSDGGAINHGVDGTSRVKTVITNTSFDGCYTTGSFENNAYGGSVYTNAKETEITGSNITNSTATNHGGALYCPSSADGSTASITGSTFENCSTTRSAGFGGAIWSANKSLAIGTTTISSCMATGTTGRSGAIYMETSGSTLNVNDGTVISGCYANQGGAIYLKESVTMALAGSPEFTRNGYTNLNGTVVNASQGACIYLAEGSTINLSGSPKFSRNNITNQGSSAQPRVTNGGLIDYVRQDLYLAGYNDTDAASINVTGELTGDTIWVWPENAPHRQHGEQFAIMTPAGSTISDASLQMMRNALSDDATGCTNGEYLAGVRKPAENPGYVYWDKMYNVSFFKKDNKGVGVAGAEFTLYRDRLCTASVTTARSADGEYDVNAQGELLELGEVDFATVAIGVYYMKETRVPESFKAEDITYLVLVGTPSLNPVFNGDLWGNGGPLDVADAATLVQQRTANTGMYYGIFPLGTDGKADLSKNLCARNVGIINQRKDFEAWFMKTDAEGQPLPNAAFTLYEPRLNAQNDPVLNEYGYPQMDRWHRDGEDYPEPVKSADGTSAYKRANGSTLDKGIVYFRELPIGTYYLVESEYPVRNGNNRLTYFVESDRVFQLVIGGDTDSDGVSDFTLSEWDVADATFVTCSKLGQNFAVVNQEAVCKLTDDNGNLVYELGKLSLDGEPTYHPAIYPTLEQGFGAAQDHELFNAGRQAIGNDSANPLKLQTLKDCTISEPVSYSGARGLTFTTASRTATTTDRYVFTTTRTSDTSRAEVKRAYSEDASIDANEVALITVEGSASMTLQNINLNGQKNLYSGRALHVTDNGRLFIHSATQIHNFKQEGTTADEAIRGGAVLLDGHAALYVDGGSRTRSAVISGNEVQGDGGAISIGQDCTVATIKNAQLLANKADGNGGAVYVASGVNVPLTQGTIRGNEATLGSAFYLENGTEGNLTTLTMSEGTMTGNKASGANGGAINGGGEHVSLAFEGSPVVFNNVSASDSSQQRNVVLSEDTNGIIQTTQKGLDGGLIGVYVIGEIAEDMFQKHGLTSKPFGTYGADDNLDVFRNDRNLALYGTRNDAGTIDWVHMICKLTDASDKLLYQDEVFSINGSTVRCKAPAVYITVQDGFDAIGGKLYTSAGATFGSTSNLKLKMLGDVELTEGISYTSVNRATVFTTAEMQVSSSMSSNGDYFVYETTREEADAPATTALILRGYTGDSLMMAAGKSLTLTDIVLDGAKGDDRQANGNGGLVNLTSGALVIDTGAVLQNSLASGNGGAIYASSDTTVTVMGGEINHNECAADSNGAGIYVDGAKIRLSGTPLFGGKGTDDNGDIIDPGTNANANGNWKQGTVDGGLTNGTKDYTHYRQDLYVRGMTGDPVANIELVGNVGYVAGEFDESYAGTIWTWIADSDPTHHKDKDQFAVVAGNATVSEESYTVFRNARDDIATENSTNKYLTGVPGDAINGVTCVYWGPTSSKGSRRVILRKVATSDDVSYDSLGNATFTVYSGRSITKVDNVELKDLTSGPNGVFWIGELSYGTYYIHETTPNDRWFTLTVGDDTLEGTVNGVVVTGPHNTDPRSSQS